MMNETFYTNGKNKFKNDEFDGNEWSAPYMVDVNEIKDRINSFNLVGRKIKNIRFIGLCYNLRREWIEEIAYNNATGSEEEKQKFSNYDSIPDELQYLRFAEIDEPLLIKFEDETESRSIFYDGDIFEIDTPQQPEFRMSMNSIPWWIDAGTNMPNMEAKVLFSPCIGKTISGVEVNTYLTKRDPMAFEDFSDGSERELISSIILRLEDGTGILIEGWLDFCHVSCVNSANETMLIPFEDLKKGLFNWEDIHVDSVSGFESHGGTMFFGRCGADHCKETYMTLCPSNSDSRLHISVEDFTLYAWSIGNLFEWFDEYGDYEYSYLQWASILEEAEKILSFTTFDALFDYRTSLKVRSEDKFRGNYFLNEMNCQGRSFWTRRETFRKQLKEMQEWTAMVLGENDSISIYGF